MMGTSHAGGFATDDREHYVLWVPNGLEAKLSCEED